MHQMFLWLTLFRSGPRLYFVCVCRLSVSWFCVLWPMCVCVSCLSVMIVCKFLLLLLFYNCWYFYAMCLSFTIQVRSPVSLLWSVYHIDVFYTQDLLFESWLRVYYVDQVGREQVSYNNQNGESWKLESYVAYQR